MKVKKMFYQLVMLFTAFAMITGLSLESFPAAYAQNSENHIEMYDSVNPPDDYVPVESGNQSNKSYLRKSTNISSAKVLLIEDTLPWDSNANSTVLNKLNIPFDKVKAADFLSKNLGSYSVLIFANDQSFSTYSNYSSFMNQVESFASLGGTVIFGACDGGWASGSLNVTLPGGVTKFRQYSNKNYIVDSNHPIITGVLTDNIKLTTSDLVSSYCSHTCFTESTLPSGSKIILRDEVKNAPTLVEYPLGTGKVIASGLTWEHNFVNYKTFAPKAMDDLFMYAVDTGNTDVNLLPPLALSVSSKNTLEYADGDYSVLDMSVIIKNVSNVKAENIKLTYSSSYFDCTNAYNTPTSYPYINAGDQVNVKLNFKLKPNLTIGKETQSDIKINITYPLGDTGNYETKEITKYVNIPVINKAIVIVPGIMGSRLYDEDGKMCWEPFWSDELENSDISIFNLIESIDDLCTISCDENGESDESLKLGTQYFGAQDTYENLYNRLLNEKFNTKTKVIFYAYDWRMDIDSQIADLYEKIKDYDDVNFVAHSMGGLLVDSYVNNYNTDNVSKIVTLGAPFNGAPWAAEALLTGDISDLMKIPSLKIISPGIQSLVENFTSVYELLPNEKYVNNQSWLKETSVKRDSWWQFWNFKIVEIDKSYDEIVKLIGEHSNKKLMEKAVNYQSKYNDPNAYKDIETIAFYGIDKKTPISYSYTIENGVIVMLPTYSESDGDEVVPISSSKQLFSTFKDFNVDHLKLAKDDTVIDNIILFLQKGAGAVPDTETVTAAKKTRSAYAANSELNGCNNNCQLAFKGNMNLTAFNDNEENNLILAKDSSNDWTSIYKGSENFYVDRMGSIDEQELYVCTFFENSYSFKLESLEKQNIDIVFSNGSSSYVIPNIPVDVGSVLYVDTEKLTVNVDYSNSGNIDNSYNFKDINEPTIEAGDISVSSMNCYSDTITNTIAARIKIDNLTEKDFNINDLEIKYVYNNDGNNNEVFECDWAGNNNNTITSSVNGNIDFDETLNNTVASIKFNSEQNVDFNANGVMEIHFRIHTADWQNYDLSNDYSLNEQFYSENERILIYYKGELVYGAVS